MQYAIVLAICLHVLSAIFWAGSTMYVSASGNSPGMPLFLRQMLAAAIAVLSGTFLWHTVHGAVFQATERVLAVGGVCALLALVIQAGIAGPAIRKMGKAAEVEKLQARTLASFRFASLLLVVTAFAMAASKYAGVFVS
ncbi:hypothetical protein [Undibacterium sp.]|uniref:hypothetical protein n=1 Tax=Undibacterium sp. TaxID=1914977 RepID=UPI00374CF8B9